MAESPYVIRADGESTGPAGRYLVWHYIDGRLEIESEDSFKEALSTARMWNDSEYGSFHAIEGPAGLVPHPEVEKWIRTSNHASWERDRARHEDLKGKLRYHVMVMHAATNLVGEYESTFDRDEAFRAADELNLPGRVQIYTQPYGLMEAKKQRQIVKDWND